MSVTQDVFNEDGKFMRKIRSFVRREGRLTKAGEGPGRALAGHGHRF